MFFKILPCFILDFQVRKKKSVHKYCYAEKNVSHDTENQLFTEMSN